MADLPDSLFLSDRLLAHYVQYNDSLYHKAAAELRRLAGVEAERDALRAALEVARRVIAHDRQSLIDCSTNPAGAIDRDAAEHVAYYDAALAQIDAATKGGGNG